MNNLITREEAINAVGLANVDELDELQCQPGRWLWKRGPLIEWAAAPEVVYSTPHQHGNAAGCNRPGQKTGYFLCKF